MKAQEAAGAKENFATKSLMEGNRLIEELVPLTCENRQMTVDAMKASYRKMVEDVVSKAMSSEDKRKALKELYKKIHFFASQGLIPNGIDGEIVMYVKGPYTDDNGRHVEPSVVIQWGYKGLAKMAANSGVSLEIPGLVREGEHVEMEVKNGRLQIEHNPEFKATPVIGAYAFATYKGRDYGLYMNLTEIEDVKKSSKSVNNNTGKVTGPWLYHEGEMIRKTVVKRLLKNLISLSIIRCSDDVEKSILQDEENLDTSRPESGEEMFPDKMFEDMI